MVRLLDCTLRDGGYINDWNFGKHQIYGIVDCLNKTNIDIIELGFLRDEIYNEDRVIFNTTDFTNKKLGLVNSNAEYALMTDVLRRFPIEKLPKYDGGPISIIRVMIWKTKYDDERNLVNMLEESYAYCKEIVEKGYKLCIQPARVDQYSDDEFVDMLQLFQRLNPLAIYVVDSWGTLDTQQIQHYVRLCDKYLEKEIAIGYHGHNNMMQTLGIATDFVNMNLDREIYVDASVFGMGRGAGNLNSELFADYLNHAFHKHYEIAPMIEIYERFIKSIYLKHPWGFSIPYFITAKYNCNPNYGEYYTYKKNLNAMQIEKIICRMPKVDRILYCKETADKCLQDYLDE